MFFLFSVQLAAQNTPLFSNTSLLEMVDRGGDFIYNQEFQKAEFVIDSLEQKLPEHPIVPMMKAMSLAWRDQPIRTSSPVYPEHEKYLMETIAKSERISAKDPNNLEAMFFEMSAHGLLAEYYAQEGSSFKAMGQAKQTYNLHQTRLWNMTDSECGAACFFLDCTIISG